MKKFFLSLAVLSAAFLQSNAQSFHVLNMSPCTVTFAVHGHDGSSWPGCGMLASTPITIGPGGSILFSDVAVLNNCASPYNWLQVCTSGGPLVSVVGSAWDYIDQFSGPSYIVGPAGGCSGFPNVVPVAGCPTHTIQWNSPLMPPGTADLIIN